MKRTPLGRVLVVAFGVSALLLVATLAVALERGIGNDALGRANSALVRAADFSLETVSGRNFVLAEHREQPVFVYFWASWCAPCESEAPLIESLWPEYRDRGFIFVGVNIWDSEPQARAFVERHGLTFPIALNDQKAYLDYGVYGVPEAFFLAKGLLIEARFIGELTEAELREHLERIAAASSPG